MKVLVVIALLAVCVNAIEFGRDAAPHAAKYMVSLSDSFDKPLHKCGGTIISTEWILTAARCIGKKGAVGMGATAGLHVRTDFSGKTQNRRIDFAKIHEKYIDGTKSANDIALLHVSSPFEFNEWVNAAVLPPFEEIPVGNHHVYGWGRITPFGPNAEVLQTITASVWTPEQCQYFHSSTIYETNICSDSQGFDSGACHGDTGGPIVKQYNNGEHVVVGIVSWNTSICNFGGAPPVYTRVSYFIDWITRHTTDAPETSSFL